MSGIMKSYNVKIQFTTEEDKQKLLQTLTLQRDAWNIVSPHRFSMHRGSLKVLHDKAYKDVKNKIPTIPSQYIIKAEQGVIAAYQTIRSNKQKIDVPATKKNLSCQLDERVFTWKNLEKTQFSITTLDKRIKCSIEHYDRIKSLDWSKTNDPSIFVRNNEIFLTIPFNDTVEFVETNKAIGLDLGIRRIVSTSNGDIIKDKVSLKHKRKIRFLKRQLKSKIDTNKSRSAKNHLEKLKHKERNFNKNWTHHVVNKTLELSKDASTIVIEDLKGIKRTKKSKTQGNMKSQWNPFEFRTILTYKAQALGKRVVTVKPHLTSQLDHRGLDGGTRKGCRYIGSDGIVMDADVNAAINILHKYDPKHPVSCCALDGQVNVNSPYGVESNQFQALPVYGKGN